MQCNTVNVIYSLICINCKQFYVGETNGPLNIRINLHRNQCKHISYCKLAVSSHLFNCNKEFLVAPIYKLPDNTSTYLRRKMEHFFINYLKPTLNAAI